ncbi:MAG: hypothetical protein U0234_11140 [Sandaracinus sp.]
MRNRLSFVLLLAAAGGCNPPPPVATDAGCGYAGGPVCLRDGGGDTGTTPDTGADTDTGPEVCSSATGNPGSHCRMGQCLNGATCLQDISTMGTFQMSFGLTQGEIVDGWGVVQTPVDPTEAAPFNAAVGTLCATQCDLDATADSCGNCNSCSRTLTQMPAVATFGGVRTVLGTSARYANTGFCRTDCTWSATAASPECADSTFACDSFGAVCVEACTTDVECNTNVAITYDGEIVTFVNDQSPDVCNHTTGRCEPATSDDTAMVGDTCTSNADCPSTGVCLSGGHCATFGCTTATCTGAVCVGVSDTSHPQTLCIKGCNTVADCGPGNTCSPLSGTVNGFTGICLGVCQTDDECAATETCSDTTTTNAMGQTVTNPGQCVPRCGGTGAAIAVGAVGTIPVGMDVPAGSGNCNADEWCQPDHMGATYGQCSARQGFCGESDTMNLPAASTECATGDVCDETLATPHAMPGMSGGMVDGEFAGDGHCTPACASDADCSSFPAGSTCVTDAASPLHGLCRVPCAGAGDTCPADQVCNPTLGRCVEVQTM